jgi:tyrosyl-tRNA synthetase
LSFEGENAAEIVNNYDWFKEMGFLEFLRNVGKYLTVNYMMAKDSVKNRLGEGGGISFTEFSYQLLQGYDFYWLYKNKGVKIQMGGSDQWGNITTGTELIRRIDGGEAFALTTPLLTKADGTKFGKSESGNVWLDASMTSPYKFYQFFINQADADMHRLIRVFSLKTQEEIEALEAEHKLAPEKRILQKALAEELTERIHSKKDLGNAIKATNILFGKDAIEDLKSIDENTLLEVFDGVAQVTISKDELSKAQNVVNLLSEATQNQIFKSKGEARKAIQNNAVSINKIKITSPEQSLDFELLQNKYLLAQNGKKSYFLIRVQ